MKAKILKAPASSIGFIPTTTKSTGISQRDTLEQILINLASSLGIKEIHKRESARGSFFYEVQASGFRGYQSASNTILDLSRHIAERGKA